MIWRWAVIREQREIYCEGIWKLFWNWPNWTNHFLLNLRGRTKAKFHNLWNCAILIIITIDSQSTYIESSVRVNFTPWPLCLWWYLHLCIFASIHNIATAFVWEVQVCIPYAATYSFPLPSDFALCTHVALGRGLRQKNGKILTELSFFAVFNHKNDLEKVWKSKNIFNGVGF